MKALEVMQRQVVTVTAEASIDEAVRLMILHRIGSLPVLEPAGLLVGILCQSDLVRRIELGTEARVPSWLAWLYGPGRDARDYVRSHARRVGEVMTVPVISVTPETELSEVVALMESRRIRHVPVLENGRLAGILTRSDLVRALSRLLPKVDTQPVADAEIRHRVIASLREQRWMPRTSFDVRVQNGVVELAGLVTDEREREAVRVLAENTPGVREVIDRFVAISLMAGVPLDLPEGSPRE